MILCRVRMRRVFDLLRRTAPRSVVILFRRILSCNNSTANSIAHSFEYKVYTREFRQISKRNNNDNIFQQIQHRFRVYLNSVCVWSHEMGKSLWMSISEMIFCHFHLDKMWLQESCWEGTGSAQQDIRCRTSSTSSHKWSARKLLIPKQCFGI